MLGRRLWSPVICLFVIPVIGCSIGSMVVNVEPDGSGEIVFSTLKLEELEDVPEVNGASKTESFSYEIERIKYSFERLSAVSYDGITFDVGMKGPKKTITMTIPLTRDTAWVRQMKLTEKQMDRVRKKIQQITDRMEERDTPVNLDPEEALNVKFQINLPRNITNYEIDAPELEDHEWMSDRTAENRAPSDQQIAVDVPVRAIFNADMKKISIQLTYKAKDTSEQNDQEKEQSDEEVRTF